jgi:SAM-dependent methyltransferase
MPFWSIEPILQEWRIRQVLPHILYGGIHLDIGCDLPPVLINRVKARMKRCIGIDVAAKPGAYENIEIMNADIQKKIPLPSQAVDVITMLAVLEHLHYPEKVMAECYRLLKPGGSVLLTVPTPANKPLLELLATLRLVRPDMIKQHKHYFTHTELSRLFSRVGFSQITVSSFEWGLNTLLTATK